ncbi:MAG: hypothetical protein IJ218_02135 [Alphaproteobacteria bacterium]|nr:hypothetical protein [Alphaproteobacteria bacterium]
MEENGKLDSAVEKEIKQRIAEIYKDMEIPFRNTFPKNKDLYKKKLPTKMFAKQLLARIAILKFFGKNPKIESYLYDSDENEDEIKGKNKKMIKTHFTQLGFAKLVISRLVIAKLLLTHPLNIIGRDTKKYISEIKEQYNIRFDCESVILHYLHYYNRNFRYIFQELKIDTETQQISTPNLLLDENIVAIVIDIRTPLAYLKKRIEEIVSKKRDIGTKEDALSKGNIDRLQYKYNKKEYGDNILHYIDYKLLTSLGFRYKQENIAADMFENCKEMTDSSRVAKVKTTVNDKFKEIMNEKYAYKLLDFLENQKKNKSVTKKNKGR